MTDTLLSYLWLAQQHTRRRLSSLSPLSYTTANYKFQIYHFRFIPQQAMTVSILRSIVKAVMDIKSVSLDLYYSRL